MAFGRHERRVADLWRGMFLSLDDWTKTIVEWAPEAQRILELGCGEGSSTMKLASAFPNARIDAVDIASNIGRLYTGVHANVRFQIAYAEDLAEREHGSYDLIILSDVLHHVPAAMRESLMTAVRTLLAPAGVLAFKDWHRNIAPIYFFAYASDRWLTGDRIAYLTRNEARHLLKEWFGEQSISAERSIAPWTNNYAMRIVVP